MTNVKATNHQPADYVVVPAADFHFLTPVYDCLCVLFGLGRAFQRGIVERLALAGTARVLDVGCGTGMFLDELTRRYPRITAAGVDVDPAILRIAARRLNQKQQRAKLFCAQAECLPFPTTWQSARSLFIISQAKSSRKRLARSIGC